MSAAPILLLGAQGQLGRELSALAAARGVPLIGLSRADCDITDAGALANALATARPRLAVNAAAYTAVDKAESEPDAAHGVNALAPGLIAAAAQAAGIPLVHISTDYVFDGSKPGAYAEDDAVAPLGVYGRTKEEGERRIREAAARHVILRTSWVYGIHGANFLKTMLRLAADRDVMRVVADQHGCPTATADLAEAILAVDAALQNGALDDGAEPWGTYHFAGQGRTSWHGFAQAIMTERAAILGSGPRVEAIGTADYPTPARRPANSVLDSGRFAATFGLRARPWQERVREAVQALTQTRTT